MMFVQEKSYKCSVVIVVFKLIIQVEIFQELYNRHLAVSQPRIFVANGDAVIEIAFLRRVTHQGFKYIIQRYNSDGVAVLVDYNSIVISLSFDDFKYCVSIISLIAKKWLLYVLINTEIIRIVKRE